MFLFLPFVGIQRAEGPGGRDGAGHRHVLPLPASQGYEELPSAAWGVSCLCALTTVYTPAPAICVIIKPVIRSLFTNHTPFTTQLTLPWRAQRTFSVILNRLLLSLGVFFLSYFSHFSAKLCKMSCSNTGPSRHKHRTVCDSALELWCNNTWWGHGEIYLHTAMKSSLW